MRARVLVENGTSMDRNDQFLYSKTGVKVYRKPEYNPTLMGTNLLHPDFVRKTEEVFGRTAGSVNGLSKICSANSEDALTWKYFSPLLEMTSDRKQIWLQLFLEEAIGARLGSSVAESLTAAEVMFWRGKKATPFYKAPHDLGHAEGNTEVDLSIQSSKALIFVEAKYHSEIALHTSHSRRRDQIIRNLDVGTHYAWNRGMDFYFILLATPKSRISIERLNLYRNNPSEIVERLPHRSGDGSKLERLASNLGLITWERLDKLARASCR